VPRNHQPPLTPLDPGVRCAPASSGSVQKPGATWPGFLPYLEWAEPQAPGFSVFPSNQPSATASSRERYAARLPIVTVDGQRTCSQLAAGKSARIDGSHRMVSAGRSIVARRTASQRHMARRAPLRKRSAYTGKRSLSEGNWGCLGDRSSDSFHGGRLEGQPADQFPQ
jgi:hypothetical protein